MYTNNRTYTLKSKLAAIKFGVGFCVFFLLAAIYLGLSNWSAYSTCGFVFAMFPFVSVIIAIVFLFYALKEQRDLSRLIEIIGDKQPDETRVELTDALGTRQFNAMVWGAKEQSIPIKITWGKDYISPSRYDKTYVVVGGRTLIAKAHGSSLDLKN